MQDPEAKKPEDWDEREKIDDPEDVKPEGWDDEPEMIVDAEATKPADWDEEEDGEWEPPQIKNPKFKGTWKAKKIANPAYKGKWEVRPLHLPCFVPIDCDPRPSAKALNRLFGLRPVLSSADINESSRSPVSGVCYPVWLPQEFRHNL